MSHTQKSDTARSKRVAPLGFVAGALVGIGLSCVGAVVWDTLGNLEATSRKSDLRILWLSLVQYGEQNGHYPETLDQVLRETGLDDGRVKEEELIYPAAGKPYDEAAKHMVVFYERAARRYGFIRGRYLHFQNYWCFCLTPGSGIGVEED